MKHTTPRPAMAGWPAYGLALFLFILPSCALFTDDATPALQASQAREGIFLRQSRAFETVVAAATGVTMEQKKAMLSGIAKDRADYLKLTDATHEWLEELGNIDFAGAQKIIYNEWRKTQ